MPIFLIEGTPMSQKSNYSTTGPIFTVSQRGKALLKTRSLKKAQKLSWSSTSDRIKKKSVGSNFCGHIYTTYS